MSGYKSDSGIASNSKKGALWEHPCNAKSCNAWGTYGYKTRFGDLYFCRAHKQEGEDALAGRKP